LFGTQSVGLDQDENLKYTCVYVCVFWAVTRAPKTYMNPV